MTDPRIRNREITTAVETGDLEKLISLVRSDPEILKMMTPFGTWLHVAASAGRLEVVKYLLSEGLDPNERGGIFNGGALHRAASNGYIDVVKYLLARGAQLDVSEPDRNPLFAAIYGGHMDIVRFLVEKGIDFRVGYTGESMKNMDASAFARERGESEIADFLENMK